ncbi:TerB N-terminal domain-containing protein [uncultured Limosilactobacillus sp.]|uniref:TerB N-terminal domain-containing protein n=1 Tax=uncultured Limosilactobacillus sp. TaxID=2837629 RepID=UPI0025FD18BB|nr:TerB N-terminal domain-containing protein [uncultured Limosilactobacillus sp.]
MEKQAFKNYLLKKYGIQFKPSVINSLKVEVGKIDGGQPFLILSRTTSNLDVKCPGFAETIQNIAGFARSTMMKQPEWVSLKLDQISNRDLENVIDYAFKAVSNGNHHFVAQQLVYLPDDETTSPYRSQVIPTRRQFSNRAKVPAPLAKMMASYDYSLLPINEQGENFYRQGQMVANYEDHYDQIYELRRYYPDYHSMNVQQLRTYFTWRTQLRHGDFTVSSTSYAYVYIYELLNNIGVENPDKGFEKLVEFDQQYAASYGQHMKDYLHQWLQDYVLYYGLARSKANQVFADQLKIDRDYHTLRHPKEYSATEIMDVFLEYCTYLKNCRLYKKSPQTWSQAVVWVWKTIMQKQPQVFTQLIATQTLHAKYFFAGAVFSFRRQPRLTSYPVDSERTYQFKDRKYYCQMWLPLKDQQKRLNAFFHELDRLTRQVFHLGHPLKPRQLDPEILQLITEGLQTYQQQLIQERQPKVHLNLASLDQIRQDASVTRESLLTDEEKEPTSSQTSTDEEKTDLQETSTSQEPAEHSLLTTDEQYLLTALLHHQPYQDYLKNRHLMASILVDSINEKLFDEIGDSVIDFNGQDEPEIVDDYENDVRELLEEEHS